MPKQVIDTPPLRFPAHGTAALFHLKSLDGKEAFLVDVNRKGQINVSKCTYQKRYAIVEILLRLDIDGPPHENPDGVVVPCPHLHVFREGFGTKWAMPLPSDFANPADLVLTCIEFLKFCKVNPVPDIQRSL
jgi:hypothetical protein